MEKLKAGLNFIFSSYKRTATVLIIFGIALTIPVTLNFLGQQQDIRQRAQESTTYATPTIACSQEAKLCPDGSYVSRTGPNCEYAPCPEGPTPTATPSPSIGASQTSINLALGLAGIGNATESARGINNNPKRPARSIEVKLLNAQNQEVFSSSGSASFESSSGLYKSTIDLGNSFVSGPYIVRVRMDNTLWRNIPGIQNIAAGQENNITQVSLISGDVNQDNEINLLDYSGFTTCYRGGCAELQSAGLDQGEVIDFNDDGKIDELDLNILYSGFSRRKGD